MRDGLRLSSAVTKIQWDPNPHCLYGYYDMGTLPIGADKILVTLLLLSWSQKVLVCYFFYSKCDMF